MYLENWRGFLNFVNPLFYQNWKKYYENGFWKKKIHRMKLRLRLVRYILINKSAS